MANNTIIKYSSVFERNYKRYCKKYLSLPNDIITLKNDLINNPFLGTHLGGGLFKIRLAVKSKNKGKSGGFRVITYSLTKNDNNYEINLLIIYDKSEIAEVPKHILLDLVKKII